MGFSGKPDPSWILEHLAAADATSVKSLPSTLGGSVGPASPNNGPAPALPLHESRESWIMSHLADMLPVLGEMRGVQAAHETAQSGHPLMGAGVALASMLPGGKSIAKGMAGAAEREILKRMGTTADRIAAGAAERAPQIFEHYSNADLSKGMLDASFMGSGQAGAERARPGRVPMMHVYAQGAKPESQFQNLPKYDVHVGGDIYDIAKDPAGIVKKLTAKREAGTLSGDFADALEKQIQKAGYAGYHNSEYYPEIVKLYGEHPVTPHGVPLAVRDSAVAKLPTLPSQFAILTAENPAGKATAAEHNTQYNQQLADVLQRRGYKFEPVKGAYQDETSGQTLHENSFLVHDIHPAEAEQLGRQFGQNSVLTHAGLHDLAAGHLYPSSGVSFAEGLPYSELPNGQRVRSDLDWANPLPLIGSTAPVPALRLMNGKIVQGKGSALHIEIAQQNQIPFDQVQDGGWMSPNGTYTVGSSSFPGVEYGRGAQARAALRIARDF